MLTKAFTGDPLMTLETVCERVALTTYLLFNTHARTTLQGLRMLRRAHEHVLVMAALEGARDIPRPYYQAYVDALEILSNKALLVARTL
jgi:hypothetical protein